jgi:tripartite-type tricarboxylate transporter receptor subunit TctC
MVARAPPDGYTLLAMTSTNAINTTVYQRLTYDFARDIAPIAGAARLPGLMVVTPLLPANTIPEFIVYAKANPGKVTMASGGTGSFSHVAGELFKAMAGQDLLHVPYRGNYFPDLLAGQVHVSFGPIGQSIQFVRAGQLRALAMTGITRVKMLPDIPTIADFYLATKPTHGMESARQGAHRQTSSRSSIARSTTLWRSLECRRGSPTSALSQCQ